MKTLTKEITIINEGNFQFPILPNGAGWKSTEKENLSVMESGGQKVLRSRIIKAIDNAKELICLQSFLIQDTAVIDALTKAVEQRQVKVYVLSSAEARLKETIEEEADFIKANYIQLLETKFKNNFIHRTAENFHGKYILIDPNKKAKGFICTNNFTENGFTKNPELAVELNEEQCKELFKVFVYHFWEYSTDEQTATKEFDKVQAANKFTLPKLKKILLTSPNTKSNSLNDSLLKAVTHAEKSISISTFLLDRNTELVKSISEKAKQGIEVTLFCRPLERQFNEQLKDLLEIGFQIFFHPLTHAKSLLVDSKVGFVFTANLVANGLDKGLEVGANLDEQQVADLATIHESWKANFPSRAVKAASIKDLKEVDIFKEGKLTRKILLNENKEEKQKANKVADLISFFNKKVEVKDSSTKSLKLKLTAEIEDLPKNIQVNGTDKFEVIEVEEVKGEKTKLVVLKKNFAVEDLKQLGELKDCRIYYH